MADRHCLRCKTEPLADLASSSDRISFFECPSCHRHCALRPGGQLTFRWLHPISLALYPVLFDESPSRRAPEVAALVAKGESNEQLEVFAREIRLELDEPTQRVRDILECRASEEDLRSFLESVAERLEGLIGQERAP